MTKEKLKFIVSDLKGSVPPTSLAILNEISSINWNKVDDDEVSICSEIILRITATVILCKFDMEGEIRDEYRNAFVDILRNIQNSTLPARSTEFSRYFGKYCLRVAELDQ